MKITVMINNSSSLCFYIDLILVCEDMIVIVLLEVFYEAICCDVCLYKER